VRSRSSGVRRARDEPKDPPAQRLTVGRGGAVLSTKSGSGRENRSGLLGVRDVPGVVEDCRLPGSGRPLGPCAATGITRPRSVTTVAALVDPPHSPARLGVPAGVERRPRRHRVHPVQRQIHVAASVAGLRQQNGTDWDRSWRSPCSCLIRSSWSCRPGGRQRSRWNRCHDEPGAAGDTAESTPTQGKTTGSKVTPSTKPDRRRLGTASGRCIRSPTWSGRSPAVSPNSR
jgi:hypothetical protein